MITFALSIVALIVGYFVYGSFVERVFKIEKDRVTPAHRKSDGVDFVVMKDTKSFLIQFLNIAGTGPIFGAIAGALWGPIAFLWIVFGCIFAGAVHDFLIGMMSLRENGTSVAELAGQNLGRWAKYLMVIFSVVLLILVGVVFISSPADILADLTSINKWVFVGIIFLYYIMATVMPIDKIIGKIYPLFGISLLIMAIGIICGLIINGYTIPELTFRNLHPDGKSIFPYLFISIACGAVSGFHATQSPMIARCLNNEVSGRRVFYGAMITEGIVALIWAAVAMTFFGSIEQLAQAGSAPIIVNKISIGLLGPLGALLAILGVVACPITSGDTAFRSARLTIADAFGINQSKIYNRFMVCIPLFIIAALLLFVNFEILWRYFSWANQTLAAVALWTAASYLKRRKKLYVIALIPAMFMTVVVTTYIIIAPEGFGTFFKDVSVNTIEQIGLIVGFLVLATCTITFFIKVKVDKKLAVDDEMYTL